MQPLEASLIYLCMYVSITSGHKNSACPLNKHDRLVSALLCTTVEQVFFSLSDQGEKHRLEQRENLL